MDFLQKVVWVQPDRRSLREHALVFHLWAAAAPAKVGFSERVLSGVLGDYSTTAASMDVLTATKYDRPPYGDSCR